MLDQIGLLLPGWLDVVEILLVAYVIYRLLLFVVGTRAMQILFGVVFLALVYVAAFLLKLNLITYLLGLAFTYGAFAAVVVFQPELRSALAHLGRSPILRWFSRTDTRLVADEIAEGVDRLSRTGTGAIIALEGEVGLSEFIESGSKIDASVSADLLATIFTPYSPLHDGAVIVRGDRIVGAGAILPLTQFPVEDKSLGTRHRAALGLSEETDATVIVISEETSKISIARGGMLYRGVQPKQVSEFLSGLAPRLSGPQLEPTAS